MSSLNIMAEMVISYRLVIESIRYQSNVVKQRHARFVGAQISEIQQ